MKKIILFLSLVLIPAFAMADMSGLKVPTNQTGSESSIQYAGVQSLRVTAIVEQIVSSNTCVLYGIFVSSSTIAGSYVVFRDTNAVNGSGTQTVSTFDIDVSSTSRSILIDPPVRFYKGMTTTFTQSVGYPASITVLYLDQ